MSSPLRILIPLAAYGHDPTEVAIPFAYFTDNPRRKCEVTFATADGTSPQCDSMMLTGMTGAALGASAEAKAAYHSMSTTSHSWQNPISWRDPSFDVTQYDCVFLPGGHEKGVRSIIEDETLHAHLRKYFPLTDRKRSADNKKAVAAICHGVQVLAFTSAPNSALQKFPLEQFHSKTLGNDRKFKSIIHACQTTALPGYMESGIFTATRALLGDYYKTFGGATPNVEDYVKVSLDDPSQFKSGPSWSQVSQLGKPFVVEDPNMRYLSARYPPDAKLLAERTVETLL